MEKSQKWFVALLLLLPIILIFTSFLLGAINLKEISVWVFIGVLVTIIGSPIMLVFMQRSARWQEYTPLQKKRKQLLVMLISFVVILLFMNMLSYNNNQSLRDCLWNNIGIIIQFIIFLGFFFYAYFRKEENNPS